MELKIKEYTLMEKDKWDKFVLEQSMNGTFLQTRNFLEYHKDKFHDKSLIVYKGVDTIVAVIPACEIKEGEKKIFSAHKGSTFGGIVIGKMFYNVEHVDAVIDVLEEFFSSQKYNEVHLKCTSNIFSEDNTELLSYFLFQRGYLSYDELTSYIDFRNFDENIISNFTASRRRGYKYSLKNNLVFKKLESRETIQDFYYILCDNLRKFDTKPVHTLEELIEFKETRLADIVEFYGVYYEENMVAGSMMFNFKNKVLHAQYFAADQEHLDLYPMNFLDANLIRVAKERDFEYFSFGISTEEQGKYLNKKLMQFKEGFGGKYGINKTYFKILN